MNRKLRLNTRLVRKTCGTYFMLNPKAWGLALLAATVGLFGFGYGNTLWLPIAFCWLNSLEEITMTLLLPTWQCDILSIFHAVELRKALLRSAVAKKMVVLQHNPLYCISTSLIFATQPSNFTE